MTAHVPYKLNKGEEDLLLLYEITLNVHYTIYFIIKIIECQQITLKNIP
jgi:hypothetical protein